MTAAIIAIAIVGIVPILVGYKLGARKGVSHLRRALVVSSLVLAAIVVASPAGAVTVTPPSLVGEQLFAGPDSTGGLGV